MTTFAHRSDSPPELTSSKSSKSSSFHSSSFSGPDGGLSADLAHFEDIGLDDDQSRPIPDVFGQRMGKATATRNLAGPMVAGRNHSPAMPAMRELVNGSSRSSLPPMLSPRPDGGRLSSQSLSLPSGSRTVINRSSTSLNPSASRKSSRSRSRSASPTHLLQSPLSPKSTSGTLPSARSGNSIALRRPSSTRGSSVPKPRKTAEEIEKEYHDSDEDLPDDFSLTNVPMSPKMYRTASAATSNNVSANPSANTSPERASHGGTPRSLRMTPFAPHFTAPVDSRPFTSGAGSAPSSPRNSRLNRTSTTGTMPDTYTFGKGRTKSWNNALGDLSEEAKALSEALDAHALAAEQNATATGEGNQPSIEAEENPNLNRSKTTSMTINIVELPPLRKNNVMIDPLPVSKEKEKVLSRTRPSWLPPKDRKEEKKHLKEYQRMMAQSVESEKRREAKEASAKCTRDDTAATLQRIWDDHVLPDWDASIREPRTRELWWRGLPPRTRPEAWKRAITNELGLTATTFEKALARAKAIETSSTGSTSSMADVSEELAWLQAIRRDIQYTLPNLNMFQETQPLHQPLLDLLSAYSLYRPDVGYAHGSHLPAALLLLTLPSTSDAFTALANILNRPVPLAFLTGDPGGTTRTYDLVLRLLNSKRPKLYQHLFAPTSDGGLAIHPHEVLEPMLRTFFLHGCNEPVKVALPAPTPSPMTTVFRSAHRSSLPHPQRTRGLSLQLVLRLWDIIVFDGDAAIIRTCMGLLAARESALYGTREEVLDVLGWGGEFGLDAGSEDAVEEIVAMVRDVGKETKK